MDKPTEDALEVTIGKEVTSELKKINESVDKTGAELRELNRKQAEEIRQHGVTSAETKSQLEKFAARWEQEHADTMGLIESQKQTLDELKSQLEAAEQKALESSRSTGGAERKTAADIVARATDFKDWNLDSGRDSPRIEVGSFADVQTAVRGRKAIVGGDALNAVLGVTNLQNIFGHNVIEPVHLRNYMNVERATGHSVQYARRTAFDNNAAFQTSVGALKAGSDHTFEQFSAEACVLAHTTTISRQQARSTPTVVNFIENEMRQGLLHNESTFILFADGTNSSIKGIANTDGILTYNRGKTGDTMIDALRRSDTQIWAQNRPTGGDLYVVNHEDWETIELMKDNEDRYLWVEVQVGGTTRMWKKPVFVTAAQVKGQFANGCFRTCATLYDFESAYVQMFPQHSDYPRRNLVLMLAEETIALAVTDPSGFVFGSYTSIGSGSGSGS